MSLIRINRNPSTRDLRVFAGLWLIFFGAAGLLAWKRGATGLALGFWIAAAVVSCAGLVAPRSVRSVWLAAVYAAFPVGIAVSYVMLGIVYFLVITPVGLCLRLARRDPLERRFEPGRKSYWIPRGPPRSPSDYFRQH